jgi:chromosome partitioning protein
MPVIAVVNRKGGSGKSTLATHLAAFCANAGMSVMLGDVDRQQSAQTWLKLRAARPGLARSRIVGWAVDPKRGLHPPVGTTHVILDTPGGLTGFDLMRVVMMADAIVMPVCNSVFDRESAAQCVGELMKLPKVASGRCKLAAVGMRLDARTQGAEVLQAWADAISLPFIGVLRDTHAYVRCIENGLTLFDQPATQAQADLLQWSPILRWLTPVLHPTATATTPGVKVAEGGRDTVALASPVCENARADASDARRIEDPPVLTVVVPPVPQQRALAADKPTRGALAQSLEPPPRWRDRLGLTPLLARMQPDRWGVSVFDQ